MIRRSISYFVLAFAVLISLRSSNTYAQPTPTPTRFRLSVAEKNSALDLILPTVGLYTVQRNNPSRVAFVDPIEGFTNDGEAALLSAYQISKQHLPSLWVVVEPAGQFLSPQDFRDFALKKWTKGAWDIKHSDHDGIALARYKTDGTAARLAQYGIHTIGAKRDDRNLEAFLTNEHLWARIRFTSESLGVEEEKLFHSIIKSASFVDTSQPATSFDYYSLGRTFSAKKDYRRAADNLASAAKLEQSHQLLNRRHFHDLIMKSAEAHVATSDLPGAAEILEYGVTRDPANETFLMQLARTHAWMGDKAKTLATLKTTFQLMKKQKEIFEKTSFPGTTSHTMSLPDLNRDPAFKEMIKDKAFREAVKALKK